MPCARVLNEETALAVRTSESESWAWLFLLPQNQVPSKKWVSHPDPVECTSAANCPSLGFVILFILFTGIELQNCVHPNTHRVFLSSPTGVFLWECVWGFSQRGEISFRSELFRLALGKTSPAVVLPTCNLHDPSKWGYSLPKIRGSWTHF